MRELQLPSPILIDAVIDVHVSVTNPDYFIVDLILSMKAMRIEKKKTNSDSDPFLYKQ